MQKLIQRQAGGAVNVPKPRAPFDVEITNFLILMNTGAYLSGADPLAFWPSIEAGYPILSRFAKRVFPSSASSADVERLFSHAGDVCTPDRARLSPRMINMLTTCNMFLRSQHGIVDKRNAGSEVRVRKFTSISIDLVLSPPEDLDALIDREYNSDPNFIAEENEDA